MTLKLRKMHITVDEIHSEMDRSVDPPLRLAVVAAVLANPWAGRGYVEDLRPEILGFAAELGTLLSDRLVATFGSAGAIEAYGKCSVVGVDGEIEHANAMVHTLMFGNPIRDAVDGASTLVFSVVAVGGAGGSRPFPRIGNRDIDNADMATGNTIG